MDRFSLTVVKDLWMPNNPGDNQPGVNNFKLGYARLFRYQNLGDQASWVKQDYRSGVNDRVNFSASRQFPNQLHLDLTFFMNYGHDLPYSKPFNMADPHLSYTHQANLARTVPDPFYRYLSKNQFPGPLRDQARVTIGSLRIPYPQYGSLTQTYTDGVSKNFRLAGRSRLEFRLEACNRTNTIQWRNSNLGVTSSLFGRIASQANAGREVQYAARIHF